MKVFVYGTLKRGQGNHYHLDGCTFIGEALTLNRNYTMRSITSFPAVSQTDVDDGRIVGEIYEVNQDALGILDKLEGVEFGLYSRETKTFELLATRKTVEAEMFLMHPFLSKCFGGCMDDNICFPDVDGSGYPWYMWMPDYKKAIALDAT